MKRTGSDSPPYSIWGIEPEIDQHEVRFSGTLLYYYFILLYTIKNIFKSSQLSCL